MENIGSNNNTMKTRTRALALNLSNYYHTTYDLFLVFCDTLSHYLCRYTYSNIMYGLIYLFKHLSVDYATCPCS